MVFKEFGGVRLFPFSEYVAFGRTYAVHDVDDPQKGADQQIGSAPSIYGRYSMATSCKFGTPVSGGA